MVAPVNLRLPAGFDYDGLMIFDNEGRAVHTVALFQRCTLENARLALRALGENIGAFSSFEDRIFKLG